jgi:hypothetical protein
MISILKQCRQVLLSASPSFIFDDTEVCVFVQSIRMEHIAQSADQQPDAKSWVKGGVSLPGFAL